VASAPSINFSGTGLTGVRKALFLAVLALPWLIAAALFIHWRQVQLAGESPCYLTWCPKNPAVYPAFVRVLGRSHLLPVQLALFAAAISWIGWRLLHQFGAIVSTAVVLGLIVNPYVWQLQGSVMSESLTTPLLILVIGCSLAWLDGRGRAYLMVAFFASALSVTARPSALMTVVIPLAALWLGRRADKNGTSKALLTLMGFLLCLVPVGLERLTTHLVLGDRQSSVLGRLAIGKASVIDAPAIDRSGMSPLEVRVATMMEQQYAPLRDTIRPLSGPVRDLVRLNYEVCIQFSCTDDALRDVRVPRPVLDRALVRVGFARLRQNPIGYLKLAVGEYRGLWSLHPRKDPSVASQYNTLLQRTGPLPFWSSLGTESQFVPKSDQKSYYRYDRMVMWLIGWAAVLLLIALAVSWLRGDRGPSVVGPLATLMGLEAILVFIALVGVGIPRYSLGLWPAIILGLGLGAFHYMDRFVIKLFPAGTLDQPNVEHQSAALA
jgi:hypothetical protein